MVVVGGITRLTGSGLSITEWNVVTGTLPPMGEADWEVLFAKYRATPQFAQINAHFGLAEFKRIFWWEYVHRLLGRVLGIVFLVPFFYFLARGWLDRRLRRRVLLLFALGAFQGVLGWLMVASGLVDRPAVSHYRLAAHLLTALATLAVTLWFALDLLPSPERTAHPRGRILLASFAALLGLQLLYGAFVAGLRAGGIFNTFPLMGDGLAPPGLWADAWRGLAADPVVVQFAHRLLAWALLGVGAVLAWRLGRDPSAGRAARWLGAAVALQFALGVVTILGFPRYPVGLGALHQSGAVLLVVATVVLAHRMVPARMTAVD